MSRKRRECLLCTEERVSSLHRGYPVWENTQEILAQKASETKEILEMLEISEAVEVLEVFEILQVTQRTI